MRDCSMCNSVIFPDESDYLVSGLTLCKDCYMELERCYVCKRKILNWEGIPITKNKKLVTICNSCYEGVVEDD